MKIKDRAKPKTPTVDPGVYQAICIGVLDLGEQYSEKYKSYSNKVRIVWALPTETIEVDGKTEEKQLSRTFTIASKAGCNLRTTIESWAGRKYSDEDFGDFDLMRLLGQACQLNVVLDDAGEYSNVQSVIPLPKGFPAPTTTTPYITWDMDRWDDDAFAKLPEWAQDQIKASTQYKTEHAPVQDVAVQAPGAAPNTFAQVMQQIPAPQMGGQPSQQTPPPGSFSGVTPF